MRIAWVTPYGENSAIGGFSAAVVAALSARGHLMTLFSSDQELPPRCHRRPNGVELLHWSTLEADPARAGLYDVIVYNVGDHFGYHCGVVRLMERYPGVCIFHDFYLVDLFLGWCASGVAGPLARSMVASIYGAQIADEFWKRTGDADFLEWAASHAPMTEWAARHALASVAHAPFYAERLARSSAGPVAVIPLAYTKPAHIPRLADGNGAVHILTLGMVNRNKRVESVVDAIGRSPFLRTRCEYNVVGWIEPSYKAELQSQIDAASLQNRVQLHGAVSSFELHWRLVEADVVCCLRWPALEGASASCIEAMLYGKATIVTDTGFYSSIPSDRVCKVRPTHESDDLARHLESLVSDVEARRALGKRAQEWAEVEYAPETYAKRIEPVLKAAIEDKPLVDALKQMAHTFRDMGVEQGDPVIQRIGSEFRALFSGASTGRPHLDAGHRRMDPQKAIANMVGRSQSSIQRAERRAATGPGTRGPGSESSKVDRNAPIKIDKAQRPPGRGSSAFPAARNAVRAALWRFASGSTQPVLSRLRSYFIEPFFAIFYNLLSSLNNRALELSESVGVLRTRLGEIDERIGTRLGEIDERVGMGLAQSEGQSRGFEERVGMRLAQLEGRLAQLERQSGYSNQLVSLLVNRNIFLFEDKIVARTPYGYLLAPVGDLDLTVILAEGSVWERTTSRLLDLTLQKGMTFVDVGAHVGLHVLHAGKSVEPGGKVIAFEPTPQVFQLLQRSVQLNGLGDVCACINVAVSSSEGTATLHLADCFGHNSLYDLGEEQTAEVEVRTASLDNLLQDSGPIDVVKIDVEGAELDVLAGMREILAANRDIMLIVEYGVPHLERARITPSEWFDAFFDHDFVMFACNDETNTWRQVPKEAAVELPSCNVVFVRDGTHKWTILKKHEG